MNASQFYLAQVNPLRGLTESRLVSLLEAGERGDYAELQWLYRFIEKRDPIGRAVKRRLLAAIGKLKWDVKAPDAGGDTQRQAMADRQKETLRKAYDGVTNLQKAINFLTLAELRGFSHLEKIYAGSSPVTSHQSPVTSSPWTITELRIVEQWFWVRDGIYAPWQYNPQARVGTYRGEAVDASRFIIREIDDPIGEIMAKLYVRKDNSDADWDGALETFGIPPTIIEGPPNVSAEKEAEYKAAAEAVASGAKGYIPNGAKVHTITPLSGGSVFKERLDHLREELVIAATSGKLTILTEGGSGTLAGQAQADAFDDIAQAIAQEINAVLQAGFDREVIARAHPGEPLLAYFELAPVDEKDGTKVLTDAKAAKDAGYAIDADELSEKSGYTLIPSAPADLGVRQSSAALPLPADGKQLPLSDAQPGQTGALAADTPGANGQTQAVASPAPATASPPATARQGTGAVQGAPAPVTSHQSPVTSDTIRTATAAQLGVTPQYLAPLAAEFDALLADAGDASLSNDELLARAEEFLRALPALGKKMDATGIAAALEAAMTSTVKGTLPA
jgi:hypothetical protein